MSGFLRKSSGFTLIELVVVIIILGVLSVVAAPKFINLSRDAKVSSVESFLGDMKSMIKLLHAKAQIQGKLGDQDRVETDYGVYEFWRGYPENKSEATNPNLYFLEAFFGLTGAISEDKTNTRRIVSYGDLSVYEDNGNSRIGYGTGTLIADKCYASYNHTATTQSFTIDTDGC
ncbi:type II secretion system protein [Shewanella woodyi]|uniref:type II secretion system protein n=1 Tax=Shewanella woodyi TaxID=60961 RepID=UPI0007F949C2|nr:prepilin-type N-terminal cleavage/methylation domain-containing protein [Shewanella woodyi]